MKALDLSKLDFAPKKPTPEIKYVPCTNPECEEGQVYIDTSHQCIRRMNDCCGGCGYNVTCDTCDGSGEVEAERMLCPHPKCHNGQVSGAVCKVCDGSGEIDDCSALEWVAQKWLIETDTKQLSEMELLTMFAVKVLVDYDQHLSSCDGISVDESVKTVNRYIANYVEHSNQLPT